MSESKFTPGPWCIGKLQIDTIIADAKYAQSNRNTGHDAVDYYGGLCIAESVLPENRALIAAAPDMYEAGKEMSDAVALLPCNDGRILGLLPILYRLRAALAKAEGKS